MWAMISTVFCYDLCKNGYGALLTTPFGWQKLYVSWFELFDDTNFIRTGIYLDDYWDITSKLEAAVELCEKLTELSGGGI